MPAYSRNSLNLRLTLMIMLGSLMLTACGIKGGLKTPPPLWGADKSSKVETANDEGSILDKNGLENRDESDLYSDTINDPFEEDQN